MSTIKEFTEFKKCFTEYQRKLGLTGYKVYFKHKAVKGGYASINTDQKQMVTTVVLNSKSHPDSKPFEDVKSSAKHEVAHLLVTKLEHLSSCRYVRQDEIYEACEELANKIAGLLRDC